MYTCRTCKLLESSKAKKEITKEEDGSIRSFKAESSSIIDIMADWYCPYYFWNTKPNGCGCKHWKYMNGKHWL